MAEETIVTDLIVKIDQLLIFCDDAGWELCVGAGRSSPRR